MPPVVGKFIRNSRPPDRVFLGDSPARKFTSETEAPGIPSPVGENAGFFAAHARAHALATSVASGSAAFSLDLLRSVSSVTSPVPPVDRQFGEEDAVRATRAFAAAVNSGSHPFIEQAVSLFLRSVKKGDADSAANNAVPVIDHVLVDVDARKGTVDSFYSRLTFTLPFSDVSSGKVRLVRVLRASVIDERLMRRVSPLSFAGMERLHAVPLLTSKKTADDLSSMEKRLAETGVPNPLSLLHRFDDVSVFRLAAVAPHLSSSAPHATPLRPLFPKDIVDSALFVQKGALAGADRSVLNDLNVLRNIRLADSSSFVSPSVLQPAHGILGSVPMTSVQAANVVKAAEVAHVVVPNNAQEFEEIASFSPAGRGTVFGKPPVFVTYTVDDPAILFGRVYRYFVQTVDQDLRDSSRSRIVEVVTDGLRVPNRPHSVFASVSARALALTVQAGDDRLVEKFEVQVVAVTCAIG